MDDKQQQLQIRRPAMTEQKMTPHQALSFLCSAIRCGEVFDGHHSQAAEIIRAALSHAEGEAGPVGYLSVLSDGTRIVDTRQQYDAPEVWPLYTHPAPQVAGWRSGYPEYDGDGGVCHVPLDGHPDFMVVAFNRDGTLVDSCGDDVGYSLEDVERWRPIDAHPAPQVAVPEGYTLVPVEMTDEIRNAIYMALHYDMSVMNPDEWGAVDKAYAAMLAAAPTVPTDEQPVSDPDEQGLREAHYQGFVSGEYTGRTGEGNSDDAWAEFISDMRGVQPDPAPDEREIAAQEIAGALDWINYQIAETPKPQEGYSYRGGVIEGMRTAATRLSDALDRLRAGKEGQDHA